MSGKNRKKKSKRSIRLLLILLFLLLLAGGTTVIVFEKPDWVFLAREQLFALGRSAPLQRVDAETLSLTGLSPQELSEHPEAYPLGTGLMLVNDSHPIPSEPPASLVLAGSSRDGELLLEQQAARAYQELSDGLKETFGTPLYIRSSYRTYEEQQAEKEAQPAIAASAGTSEHETGLALDVYVPYYAGYGFLKSDAGQYVNTDSWKYGFIIRYPFGKEKITGIPFEPWHLRYVGCPHAEIMYKNGWTLEEYLDQLTKGEFYRYGDYVISRQDKAQLQIPVQAEGLQISADNCGGYIIWWRQ